MESWKHSGFNINASVRIGAEDATGRENLARYLIRAPFSGERITYNVAEHLVRHYAYYSSVQRSRRRRQGLEKQPLGPAPIALSDDITAAKTARGNWALFIKKVFEIDPLLCPDCGGVLKIVSFIEDPRVIRAILMHLALWDVPRARRPPVSSGGHADFEYVPCED